MPIFFPLSASMVLISGRTYREKIILLPALPMTFKSAPCRAAIQQSNVDLSRHRHLGELSAARNQDHLILESFLGKITAIMGHPKTDVGAADGAVANPDSIGRSQRSRPE